MEDHLYRKTILDSGIEVHTLKIQGAVQTYYEVRLKSGALSERPGKTGVAHYLEHMMGYGSRQYKEHDLLPYFNERGGIYNYGTGYFATNYYGFALSRKIPEYAERTASMLMDPAFTAREVELERVPILAEVATNRDELKSSPYFRAVPHLYGNHRYTVPIIGLAKDVETISYEDLCTYHEAICRSGNIIVVATGDVDHEDLVRQTEVQYANIRRGPALFLPEPVRLKPGTYAVPMDSESTSINIGFDMLNVPANKTLYGIVGEMLSRRMSDVLRLEKKWVYAAGGGAYSNFIGTGATISTSTADASAVEKL